MRTPDSTEGIGTVNVQELLQKAKRLKSLPTPTEDRERLAWRVGYLVGRMDPLKNQHPRRISVKTVLLAVASMVFVLSTIYVLALSNYSNIVQVSHEPPVETVQFPPSSPSYVPGGTRVQMEPTQPVLGASELPDAGAHSAELADAGPPQRLVEWCTGVGDFKRCKKMPDEEGEHDPGVRQPAVSAKRRYVDVCTGVGIFQRCTKVVAEEEHDAGVARPSSVVRPSQVERCTGTGVFRRCKKVDAEDEYDAGAPQSLVSARPGQVERCTGVGVFRRCKMVDAEDEYDAGESSEESADVFH